MNEPGNVSLGAQARTLIGLLGRPAHVDPPPIVSQVALLRLEVPLFVGRQDPVVACWDSICNTDFSTV